MPSSKDHEGSKGHLVPIHNRSNLECLPTNTPDICLQNPPNILLAINHFLTQCLLRNFVAPNSWGKWGICIKPRFNWCQLLLPRKLTCPLKSMLGFNEFPFDMVPFLGGPVNFFAGVKSMNRNHSQVFSQSGPNMEALLQKYPLLHSESLIYWDILLMEEIRLPSWSW